MRFTSPASVRAARSTFHAHTTHLAVLTRLRAQGKVAEQPGPPAVYPQFISGLTGQERAALMQLGAVVYQPVVTLAQHLKDHP